MNIHLWWSWFFLTTVTSWFFIASGFRKLTNPEVGAKFVAMFQRLGIGKLAPLIASAELAGGMGLASGILSQWAAFGLLMIMCGAYYLDTWPTVIARKPVGLAAWVSHSLCTPEAQLIIVLITILIMGDPRHG